MEKYYVNGVFDFRLFWFELRRDFFRVVIGDCVGPWLRKRMSPFCIEMMCFVLSSIVFIFLYMLLLYYVYLERL